MDDKLASSTIKAIDEYTINEIGIPSMVLMERAALAITEKLLENSERSKKTYAIVCGTGNNGGDGLAVGRLLHQAGEKVTLFLVGSRESGSAEFKKQLTIVENLELPVLTFDADTQSFEADVVIDAIFGIGLTREVEEPHKTAIDSINRSAGEIIAVDVPSGLSADTGEVFGTAVRADITYTIGFMKQGFDRSDGVTYTGKVNRVSIGYPKESLLENVIRKEQKE